MERKPGATTREAPRHLQNIWRNLEGSKEGPGAPRSTDFGSGKPNTSHWTGSLHSGSLHSGSSGSLELSWASDCGSRNPKTCP
eukprot:8398069-Karenia_brevis.AAC.1